MLLLVSFIRINDDLLERLKQKSDITGVEISDLIEMYISAGLENDDNDSGFVDFESMCSNDVLENINWLLVYAGL